MSYQQEIPVTTKGHGDMHDTAERVAAIVICSGIRTGTVNIFNVGSTTAVGTIEFEPGLQSWKGSYRPVDRRLRRLSGRLTGHPEIIQGLDRIGSDPS
jgi:hypothetical protein